MGTSQRRSALIFMAVLASSAVSQAFTCTTSGPFLTAKNRMPSSFGLNVGSRAKPGTLLMSEMAEDYPSDTGDDRFSAGGELVKR